MIEGINIFLPTYNRPKRLLRFVKSMLDTVSDWRRLHVVFFIERGDAQTFNVIHRNCGCSFQIIYNRFGPKPHLAKFYNECYAKTERDEDSWAVSMFGDDMVFASPEWDKRIIDALNDSKGRAVVYGDDCYIQHGKLPVHLVTTRQLVRDTGEPFMANFAADMIDTVWGTVGRRMGLLRYLPDVKIRHEHNGQLLPAHRDETWRRLQKVKISRAVAYIRVGRVAERICKNLEAKGYERA